MPIDLSRNLDQLEGEAWGDPEFDSHLVQECHRLRKIPLKEFSAENLRILIGQSISLPLLVPLALEILVKDPLAEASRYRGDLLQTVAEVPAGYWKTHEDDFITMAEIRIELVIVRDTIQEEILPALGAFEFE